MLNVTQEIGAHSAHQICPVNRGLAFIPCLARIDVRLWVRQLLRGADSSRLLADSSPSSWNSKLACSRDLGILVLLVHHHAEGLDCSPGQLPAASVVATTL